VTASGAVCLSSPLPCRLSRLAHQRQQPELDDLCAHPSSRPSRIMRADSAICECSRPAFRQLRLPPVLTGLAAWLRHSASRAAVRRHRPEPGIGGVKALSGQPDGRRRAKSPCSAARLVPHVARRQARRAAPRRNPAPERRSAPAGSAGLTSSARRAGPGRRLCCQRPRGHGQRARLLGVDRTARAASSTGLLANAATVTGGKGPPGEPGGGQVARVTEPMRRVFAQVTGWPARLEANVGPPAPSWGNIRSEHTYGGPLGRRCCTLLLYCLFDLFEFRF
jgi:hypothetical protein